MSLSEPLFKPESLRNLAKDNGPEYAGRSRRALRWCADVIEAADAVVQESNQVRKDDEELIRQMLEALETGHEAATQVAAEFHTSYKGHRPDTHAALDADVERIAKALAAARAHLIDSDLSKLTERGAKAWAGVDPQKLREGKAL